jgi:arylsulfatase A-like enzyme
MHAPRHAHAHVCPTAPSRTTLFTGRHSGNFPRFGLSGTNIASKPRTYNHPLLAEVLRGAGYTTAAIGKVAPLDDPTAFGFDYFVGQVDQGMTSGSSTHVHLFLVLSDDATITDSENPLLYTCNFVASSFLSVVG